MMLAMLVAGSVLAQQTPLREITFQDGVFILKGPEGDSQISTRPKFEAMNTTTGQLWLPVDKYVLTFNENHVGFRRDNKANYSGYSMISTSPKLFSQAELEAIQRDVAAKRKSLDVTAISGWEKIGNHVYLVMRWEDTASKPWLEALVELDFNGNAPVANLLGRFNGMTTAKGKVNDKLMAENGKLYVVTQGASSAQLETYDIASGKFSSKALGSGFTDSKLIEGSLNGMGFELTPAKTMVISLIDREAASSRQVAEIRGAIHGVYAPAILHFGTPNRKVLLNLTSGAEIVIPKDCGIETANAGILLWTPKMNPKAAALYSSGNFRTLARWSKP